MANNTLLASDNFASGSLAAGWSAASGIGFPASQVTGSPFVAECAVAGSITGQFWTGLSWPGDQVNEVTATLTVEAGSQLYLMTRCSGLSSPSTMTGYYAFISNNTAAIYRLDGGFGNQTQITTTVSGLTFAAGDVWSMECAGSFIGLYQNGTRVAFKADATYATGTPGFLQVGATNVNHCKILAWRGYNTAQPVGNGIWQKQGIVLPSNAADQTGVGG